MEWRSTPLISGVWVGQGWQPSTSTCLSLSYLVFLLLLYTSSLAVALASSLQILVSPHLLDPFYLPSGLGCVSILSARGRIEGDIFIRGGKDGPLHQGPAIFRVLSLLPFSSRVLLFLGFQVRLGS